MIGFEAPLALAGLALLAIPLALHLLVRRVPPIVLLPTVRFLDRLPRPRRRLAPPRELFVLAARLLGLGALVFAAARPFVRGETTAAAGPAPLVIVLDDTLSMAHGARGTPSRLERARVSLLAELDGLAPGARAALLTTSHPRAPLEDRSTVRGRLVAAAPQPRTGSLVPALEAAGELVRGWPGARVVVASDFDRAAVAGIDQRSEAARSLRPTILDVGKDEARNAWLSSVELHPETPVAGFPLEVRARVSTEGLDPATDVAVTLELAGGRKLEANARPGEHVCFEIARVEPGLLRGELRVSAPGDSLAQDDSVGFAALVGGRLSVVVAGEDPSDVERAVEAVAHAQGARIDVSHATPGQLGRALEGARVLVLAAPLALDRPALDAVARFALAGGGLVALLDDVSISTAGDAPLDWLPGAPRPRAAGAPLALRPEDGRLEPELARGLEALELAPQAEIEPASGASVVLRDASGAAIWVERGRVAVVGFSPTGRNEGLARETAFPLLVRRALRASLGAWSPLEVEVGEALDAEELARDAGLSPAVAASAHVVSPSGVLRPLLGAPLVPLEPGVHRVCSTAGADLACFGARAPEVESRLERASPTARAALVPATPRPEAPAPESGREDRTAAVVGVGLGLLALASWASSFSSPWIRRDVPVPEVVES